MRLSATQQAAARHAGDLSLASCPGSGKTRTLTGKLLEALDESRDSTRLVACITYTNPAVHEIESRLALFSASAWSQADVETIHTFCLKHIVGPHSWRLPRFVNGFTILGPDDPEYQGLVGDIAATFRLNANSRQQFDQLARGTGVRPHGLPEEAAEAYWEALDRRGVMDFSGIIYWASVLIRDVPYIARGIASRYSWILVDEFQDTSSLQVEILRAIHEYRRTRFFLVGDPHQSIMSFAGARAELLGEFGGEIGARSDLHLLDNYRSSTRIVSLADKLCPRGAPMTSVGITRDCDHEPLWSRVPSMLEGVVETFIPELKRRGIRLADAGILASRWTSLLPIARGLTERGLPAIGPGARPYKRTNHLIAPLVEEIAAHVSAPNEVPRLRVRRVLGQLLQTLAGDGAIRMGFAGDVAVCQLVRMVRDEGNLDRAASTFLGSFAERLTEILVSGQFLSKRSCESIVASGAAMADDIRRYEEEHRTTTIGDLGFFSYGSNSLRLMTMHAAKGREFEAVALVDVFDGHVPFYTAQPGDSVESEGRRLLYVAVTRAKQVLMIFTLSNPPYNKQPSRFLHELF